MRWSTFGPGASDMDQARHSLRRTWGPWGYDFLILHAGAFFTFIYVLFLWSSHCHLIQKQETMQKMCMCSAISTNISSQIHNYNPKKPFRTLRMLFQHDPNLIQKLRQWLTGKGSTTLAMHRISKWIIIFISYLTNLKCQDSNFKRHLL